MDGLIFELPYNTDPDLHHVTARQIRTLSTYECREDLGQIKINDPVWGDCYIGDRPGDDIFVELYTNPLLQRSLGIEQLTLPKHFATMPGTTDMSRWEHLWGSVAFTRKMIEKAEANGRIFEPRQVTVWQLRTLVSDLGHTAFSHLGDWLFQGYGGDEDQHDKELMDVLDVGQITDVLQSHGYSPEEIVFPNIEDWVECPAPDLCVDRVDYGAREISRWVTDYKPSSEWQNRFELDDQLRIIMPNKQEAKAFALEFAVLATEHWGHPVHSLQEHLFGELVKSIVASEELRSIEWYGINHPRDLMLTIDYDVNVSSRCVGELNHDLFGLMLDIARAQRKIFAHGREDEIQSFVSLNSTYEDPSKFEHAKDFPHPLQARHWSTRYVGVKPNNIAFVPVKSKDDLKDFDLLPHTLDIFLPPFKPRYIDPLYYGEDKTIVRLSETDMRFAQLLEQQKAIQRQAYVARVYADPDFVASIRGKIDRVNEEWQEQLKKPRADREDLRESLKYVGLLAVGGSTGRVSWQG